MKSMLIINNITSLSNDIIYILLSYLSLDDKIKLLEILIIDIRLFFKYIKKSIDIDIININTCCIFIKNNCFNLVKIISSNLQ